MDHLSKRHTLRWCCSSICSSQQTCNETNDAIKMQRELERSFPFKPEALYAICEAFKTSSTDAQTDNKDSTNAQTDKTDNKDGHVKPLIFCGAERDDQCKVAKTLASHMKKKFLSLDFSEFKTESDISKLIGTRPGMHLLLIMINHTSICDWVT